jgi:hypothetical protein
MERFVTPTCTHRYHLFIFFSSSLYAPTAITGVNMTSARRTISSEKMEPNIECEKGKPLTYIIMEHYASKLILSCSILYRFFFAEVLYKRKERSETSVNNEIPPSCV